MKNSEVYFNQNPNFDSPKRNYLTSISPTWKNQTWRNGNVRSLINKDLHYHNVLMWRNETEYFGCGELEFEKQELWQQSTKHWSQLIRMWKFTEQLIKQRNWLKMLKMRREDFDVVLSLNQQVLSQRSSHCWFLLHWWFQE